VPAKPGHEGAKRWFRNIEMTESPVGENDGDVGEVLLLTDGWSGSDSPTT